MPVHDWQFWAVTGIAAAAVLYILRAAIPAKYRPGKRRKGGTAASLTIGGRAPKAKR